jgi:nitroreductase
MDAYAAIISKRDTRSYLPDDLDDEVVRRILQAGRMAGSAKNAQSTRVVVVTDPDQREQMAHCGDFTSWLGSVPMILVFVVPADLGRLFDIGRMAQNVMIAANIFGLASCPVTFQHQDRVREALALPDDHEGPMAVVLGHPGPVPEANPLRAPRLPLDDLVHWGRWRA